MSLLEERLSKAAEYLAILETALRTEWRAFQTEAASHPNWLYRLAAIHPRHYAEAAAMAGASCPIRGARSMPLDVGVSAAGCSCQLIWGYPCHLAQPSLVADHLFPFSFGGPSSGSNKIFLCALHNQSKGSDIHLFPWERGEPEWVSPVLQRIERSLGRARR